MQVSYVVGFDLHKLQKWKKGREQYGPTFVGNPVQELYDELLDASNYVEEIARQQLLPADSCNTIDNLIRRIVGEIALGLELKELERRDGQRPGQG